MIFRVLRHLLPNARAWSTTLDKRLRQLLDGLATGIDPARVFLDNVHDDLYPTFTRQLDEWEDEFALPRNLTDDTQRRDRLRARWQAQGGQDPRYIQGTLQAAGFDVYVHEWWQLPVVGSPESRNPLLLLDDGAPYPSSASCGAQSMNCGHSESVCGRAFVPTGYPLAQRVQGYASGYLGAGNQAMTAGHLQAVCGAVESVFTDRPPQIPTDADFWPLFTYVGAQTFPELAAIDVARRDEFETMLLQLMPEEQWIGVLAGYFDPGSAPPAPLNLAASVAGTGASGVVTLTWDLVVGATGYKVYRDSVEIATLGAVLTHDDTPGAAGSYSYTVSAINAIGEGAQSAPAQAVVPDSIVELAPTFKSVGSTVIENNGTSLDIPVPAGVVAGDGLFLFVMRREDFDVPTGFSVFADIGPTQGSNQHLTVYHKISDGTEAGTDVTVSASAGGSAGRIQGVALVLETTTANTISAYRAAASADSTYQGTNNLHTGPSVAYADGPSLGIAASTCVISAASLVGYAAGQGWTQRSVASSSQLRIGVSTRDVPAQTAVFDEKNHSIPGVGNHDGLELTLLIVADTTPT